MPLSWLAAFRYARADHPPAKTRPGERPFNAWRNLFRAGGDKRPYGVRRLFSSISADCVWKSGQPSAQRKRRFWPGGVPPPPDAQHPAKYGDHPRGMLAFPKGCPRISLGQKPTIFRNPQATAGTNKDQQFKQLRPIGSREELPGAVWGAQPQRNPASPVPSALQKDAGLTRLLGILRLLFYG